MCVYDKPIQLLIVFNSIKQSCAIMAVLGNVNR